MIPTTQKDGATSSAISEAEFAKADERFKRRKLRDKLEQQEKELNTLTGSQSKKSTTEILAEVKRDKMLSRAPIPELEALVATNETKLEALRKAKAGAANFPTSATPLSQAAQQPKQAARTLGTGSFAVDRLQSLGSLAPQQRPEVDNTEDRLQELRTKRTQIDEQLLALEQLVAVRKQADKIKALEPLPSQLKHSIAAIDERLAALGELAKAENRFKASGAPTISVSASNFLSLAEHRLQELRTKRTQIGEQLAATQKQANEARGRKEAISPRAAIKGKLEVMLQGAYAPTTTLPSAPSLSELEQREQQLKQQADTHSAAYQSSSSAVVRARTGSQPPSYEEAMGYTKNTAPSAPPIPAEEERRMEKAEQREKAAADTSSYRPTVLRPLDTNAQYRQPAYNPAVVQKSSAASQQSTARNTNATASSASSIASVQPSLSVTAIMERLEKMRGEDGTFFREVRRNIQQYAREILGGELEPRHHEDFINLIRLRENLEFLKAIMEKAKRENELQLLRDITNYMQILSSALERGNAMLLQQAAPSNTARTVAFNVQRQALPPYLSSAQSGSNVHTNTEQPAHRTALQV